jgi:2-isopropylmalate synthase
MRLDTFSVTALDVSAHDTAAHVRVTVSFHADGHKPWITAGVSSDLNQAALMAICDGFDYWLLGAAEGYTEPSAANINEASAANA